jgi:hypothetical protein
MVMSGVFEKPSARPHCVRKSTPARAPGVEKRTLARGCETTCYRQTAKSPVCDLLDRLSGFSACLQN